jgi:hypothetical protein
MVVVIVVAIAFVLIFVGMAAYYRRPPQLTRRLRSTSFSRRRSEAIRQAAADDVATILEGDGYLDSDTAPGPGSEL